MNKFRQWNESPEKGWKTFLIIGLAFSVIGLTRNWDLLTTFGSVSVGMGLGFLIKTQKKHE